jgi:Icc-related predicted phosphoesterase
VKRTRLFFATDVHGSERCFLKFLNAGKVYNADVLILGGDITGKVLIPIVEYKKGIFSVSFLGEEYHLSEGQEVEALEKKSGRWGITLTAPLLMRWKSLPVIKPN